MTSTQRFVNKANMILLTVVLIIQVLIGSTVSTRLQQFNNRFVLKRALQKSHDKPRIQKLSEIFLENDFYSEDPDESLINLLNTIAFKYMSGCTTYILHDQYSEEQDHVFLMKFFKQYRMPYVHGSIPKDSRFPLDEMFKRNSKTCFHFLIFIKDVMKCQDVIRKRNEKVVIVSKSSQWRVHEYLSSKYSQEIANLLIIVQSDKSLPQKEEHPYILYTHALFVDALGSSKPIILASWADGHFSNNMDLFQHKIKHGFSGHRFIIAVAHQPPYVIRMRRNERDVLEFGGIEINLIEMLAKLYNFSTDYKESHDVKNLGSGKAVIKEMEDENINIGLGGIYITSDRYNSGIFHWHDEDCAAFISLSSTALPRYRAIMGPFQWTVWLALTMVYLAAVILFSYSEKATLRHLLQNPEELENLFWYVFGTFTNCFTFTGSKSWTKAQNTTTKFLIGVYWMFTIIITACYTGSIIAFVTLPVFPAVVDTIKQVLEGRFDVGMLDKGWPQWFQNVSDKAGRKIIQNIDYVPNVEKGLKNVTKAFFWPYALLGSQKELGYIVKTSFNVGSKKSLLHISKQCFARFKVGILLPPQSVYSEVLGTGIHKIMQSGLTIKIKNDVEWETIRSATGKLLAANSRTGTLSILSREDRALTIDDTQGMFLLLAIGYVIGCCVLLSEIFGGCFNMCKKSEDSKATPSNTSIASNPRFHQRQTNRERQKGISVNTELRHRSCSIRSNKIVVHKSNDVSDPFGEFLNNCERNDIGNSEYEAGEDLNKTISKLFDEALGRGESIDFTDDVNEISENAEKRV